MLLASTFSIISLKIDQKSVPLQDLKKPDLGENRVKISTPRKQLWSSLPNIQEHVGWYKTVFANNIIKFCYKHRIKVPNI